MTDEFQQAIEAIRAGDKEKGYRLLARVIKADPKGRDTETAWLWMTAVVTDPEKKRQCLERVLQINPDNSQAKKGLAALEVSEQVLSESALLPTPKPTPLSASKASTPDSAEETVRLTKQCHYCAEIISISMEVCPACGWSLPTGPPKLEALAIEVSDQEIIQEYIDIQLEEGWQLASQTASSVKMKKAKRWNKMLLLLGGVFLIVWGAGLIFWLLALIDYWRKSDETINVTVDEIRAELNRTSGGVLEKRPDSLEKSATVDEEYAMRYKLAAVTIKNPKENPTG